MDGIHQLKLLGTVQICFWNLLYRMKAKNEICKAEDTRMLPVSLLEISI